MKINYRFPERPSMTVQTNHWVWGLDLSGSLQGSGGVGGRTINGQFVKAYSPVGANNASDEQLRNRPVFLRRPRSMLRANISDETIADILAYGIPALSPAMGCVGSGWKTVEGFDISERKDNGWGRNSEPYTTRWLHSDLKVMAYLYTHALFLELVEGGSLK